MSDPPQPQPAAPDSEPNGASVAPASQAAHSRPAQSDPEPDDLWAPSGPQEDPLGRTRAGGTWIAIIVFALILVLLLIFVLQNTRKVQITYFTFTGTLPLAVAMLLSAVAGVFLAAIAGTWRIFQLRKRVRKSQRG